MNALLDTDSIAITGFRLAPIQVDVWRRHAAGRPLRIAAHRRLPADVPIGRLADAVRTLAARHDILRATFRQLPWMSTPLQTIAESLDVPVTELAAIGGIEAARARFAADAVLPADAASWQVALARTPGDGDYAVVVASALIADAASLRLLLAELAALVAGEPAAPPADVQFLHYAEWVNDTREADDAHAGRAAWDAFGWRGDAPPALPFAVPSAQGTRDQVEASAPFADAATALVAWAAVLGRRTQTRDFVFGVHHAVRPFDELRDALGPFTEIVPTRVVWDEDTTVAAAAAAIEAWLPDAAERIPDADAVRKAFDRAQFGFAWADAADAGTDDLAQWDLLLACRADGDRLHLRLDYDDARLAAHLAQYLVDALAATLQGLERTAPVHSAARLGAAELRQVTRTWNDAAARDWPEGCVHRAFEAVAARQPDAPAVVADDAGYTYAQLDARANRLAHALAAAGISPGARVAIALRRCADLVTALMAVLKAGGIYVPLDPDSPPKRLALLAQRAEVAAVVTNADALDRLDAITAPRIVIDAALLAAQPDTAPGVEVSPHDAAYMIFTSGSTGIPKAVVIEHTSAVNLARALQTQIYDTVPRALRLTLNAPVSFDASVKQIVQLLNGHCLHVVPEHARRDGATLLDLLRTQRIDGLDCTPSHLKLLFAAGFAEYAEPWPSLVLVGGEAIDRDTWDTLATHNAAFYNMYGPSETTVNASFARVTPGSSPNIGKPIHNTRLYVLDDALAPLPVGVPGELCIGGRGVGRGYHGSSELTAQRFGPDPFTSDTPVSGARLYRSGDLVRQTLDGALEFLGRIDDQVKIRGYRIEPGEIVAALREHPGVGDAVVVAGGDASGPSLIAYFTPAAGDAFDADAFKLGLTAVNANETSYLYDEIFAKHSYVRHGIRLPDDACVFDVGANIGMFSMYIARRCRHPRIHAFEPLAPIADCLAANLARHVPQAQVFRHGLSSRADTVEFTYYPGYSMMSSQREYADAQAEVDVIKTFLRNEQSAGSGSAALLERADELLAERFREERHACELRRLADVIAELGVERIDLLKIDVQRAERDVLDGLAESDWARIEQIVMEVHDAAGTATEGRAGDLMDLLERRGYEVRVEQDELLRGTDRYNLYAWRPAFAAGVAARGETPLAAALPGAVELATFLAERLPDYMVPAHIVALPAIPLTRHGKVDRAALPEPDTRRPELGHAAVEPDCWQERVLADVWAQVLRIDRVGVEDDFFQLGGDSIRSIQAQALAKARGLDFPLQAVFTHHTIRRLVRHMDLSSVEPASTVNEPFALVSAADRARLPADADDAYPLAALQAGMVWHTELTGHAQTYHNASSHRLDAPFDATALRAAISGLVAAHPLLRTSFHYTGYLEPLQIVHRHVEPAVRLTGLAGLPRDAQYARIDDDARAELRTPFVWDTAPLVRFHAYDLGGETMVTVAEYHGVLDGWSLHLLLAELCARYAQALGRNVAVPAATPLRYARFVELERRTRDAPESHAYWRAALAGAAPTRLPRARDRSGERRVESIRVALAAPLVQSLNEQSRRGGAPLKSLLLAAHLRVIGAACGTDDVSTGFVTNGRPEEDGGDRVIGLYINTLPLRLTLTGTESWLALATRCFAAESDLVPHRRMPLAQIRRLCPDAEPFDVLFNYTVFHALPGAGDAAVTIVESRTHPADIDLPLAVDFEVDPAGHGIVLSLQYDACGFSHAQMTRLAASYERALAAIAANPQAACAATPLDGLAEAGRGSAPAPAAEPHVAAYEAPRTPLETRIAQIWTDLLGVAQVGRSDAFGTLGGHSLLATQIVARVRAETGQPLSLADFYCRQTVADLARALESTPLESDPHESRPQPSRTQESLA